MDDIRTPLTAFEDLARLLDFTLLDPAWSEERMLEACRQARILGIASVTVRPGDVDAAARALQGSGVAVGAVAGYPLGWSTTAVKLYEARDLLRRGATEIVLALSAAKLLSRQFLHVEQELLQLAQDCHAAGATLKALVDPTLLTGDLAIITGKLCKRTETDWVVLARTTPAGDCSTTALRPSLDSFRIRVPVEISGVRTLEEALDLYEAGCGRFATPDPSPILTAWKTRLDEQAKAQRLAGSPPAAGGA